MKEYFRLLSSKQENFIFEEFSITKKQFDKMDDDALSEIYDKLCDIEVDETIAAGEDALSKRGEMAVSIVNIVGNAMAETEGLYDEQEEV